MSEPPAALSACQKAELCASLLLQRKAENLVALNVGPLVGYTDYFLLVSGTSSRQVQAMADHLEQQMAKRKVKPLGVEGKAEGTWILLDYDEVIVHIFYGPVRQFYDLEGLWTDAPRVELEIAELPPIEGE